MGKPTSSDIKGNELQNTLNTTVQLRKEKIQPRGRDVVQM